MILKKIVLFPFAVIYGIITLCRNILYNWDILKSKSFNIHTICVGNLSVGGTGKTPHVEYLIKLLKSNTKISVLSRGYKRKTNGFICASENSTALEIGDEPLQYKRKNPVYRSTQTVASCSTFAPIRKNGRRISDPNCDRANQNRVNK